MCRTVHAVLQTLICGVQMMVRVLMTILLMIENLIRMVLQTLYNFISFMLQLLSLIPICVVFLVSARLKCFMCGGGGGCQPGRGGACDCIMSLVAIVILFFIFKSTGVMDNIFYSMGYAKAAYEAEPYVPTPGDITECSRNDTDQDIEYLVRTETYIAAVETSATTYLDALVEDYTQMILTPKIVTSVPAELEETEYFPSTTRDFIFTSTMVDVVSSLTKAATEAVMDTFTTKTVEIKDTAAPEIIEFVTDETTVTETNTNEVVYLITTETTKVTTTITTEAVATAAEELVSIGIHDINDIVSDIATTSSTLEEVEIESAKPDYTEATETNEIIDEVTSSVFADISQTGISPTRVADEITFLVDETEAAVTSINNEVADSKTAHLTKEALDIEVTDAPFNTDTQAPDMDYITDTPSNEIETTLTTLKTESTF